MKRFLLIAVMLLLFGCKPAPLTLEEVMESLVDFDNIEVCMEQIKIVEGNPPEVILGDCNITRFLEDIDTIAKLEEDLSEISTKEKQKPLGDVNWET